MGFYFCMQLENNLYITTIFLDKYYMFLYIR